MKERSYPVFSAPQGRVRNRLYFVWSDAAVAEVLKRR